MKIMWAQLIASKKHVYTNNKQRNKDGVKNEFLFLYRHPQVPFPFYDVTSLHPPSSQRNDFSTFTQCVVNIIIIDTKYV